MSLKKSTGNMYPWVTHTWNPVKGKCEYDCSYCYVKKWGEPGALHFDESVLHDHLGEGNYIFVCSGCDLFEEKVPVEWIHRVFFYTRYYPDNKYLWHTKNPGGVIPFQYHFGKNDMLCVTIESNREYRLISKAPVPWVRFGQLANNWKKPWMLTIEPILEFDLDVFLAAIEHNMPVQVNIGADSGRNGLPEPSASKINALIEALGKNTTVHLKKNLNRLLVS